MVGCTQRVISSLHRSCSQIHTTFSALELRNTVSPTPIPTPLCKHHYRLVYHHIEPTQIHCVTCGTSLRRDSNPKLCPEPKIIQQHLSQHTGFEGVIAEGDKVCYTCYRSHLFIIFIILDLAKTMNYIALLLKYP